MKNRHSGTIILILGFGFFSFCVLALGSWYLLKDHPIQNRKSSIQKTRNWARLEKFPVPEKDLKIEVSGSLATRQFRISFEAKASAIQGWLIRSAGPASAEVTTLENGASLYKIKPGADASFAELKLSKDKSNVRIEVHWKEGK